MIDDDVDDVDVTYSQEKSGRVQIRVNTTCRNYGVFEHPEHRWIDATARKPPIWNSLPQHIVNIEAPSVNSFKKLHDYYHIYGPALKLMLLWSIIHKYKYKYKVI